MLNKLLPSEGMSSEFWAIIGSAIAIGALMLTVSGWHRGDIQSLRAEMIGREAALRGEMGSVQTSLRGEMGSFQTNLRGELANLEANLRSDMGRLERNLRGDMERLEVNLRGEIRAVDAKLSSKIDELEQGQARIDARLAVVESHVLGASAVAGPEGDDEVP